MVASGSQDLWSQAESGRPLSLKPRVRRCDGGTGRCEPSFLFPRKRNKEYLSGLRRRILARNCLIQGKAGRITFFGKSPGVAFDTMRLAVENGFLRGKTMVLKYHKSTMVKLGVAARGLEIGSVAIDWTILRYCSHVLGQSASLE